MRLALIIFISVFFLPKENIAQKPSGQYENDSLIVYVFMLEDCVICQNYSLTLQRLHKTFTSDQIQFKGLFPNKFSNSKKITVYKEKYQIPFDLKRDYYQTTTKKMGATVTPEIAVYNKTKDEILYRGRIDNMYYKLGKKRTITTTSELEDVLNAVVNGENIPIKETTAIGCFINFKL